MSIIEDAMKVLDRSAVWRRLQQVPAEVDDLKQRLGELEEKLGGKRPAEVCRYCGERSVRLHGNYGTNINGNVLETWRCSACGKDDELTYKPSAR
jgi:hypothetical protein